MIRPCPVNCCRNNLGFCPLSIAASGVRGVLRGVDRLTANSKLVAELLVEKSAKVKDSMALATAIHADHKNIAQWLLVTVNRKST